MVISTPSIKYDSLFTLYSKNHKNTICKYINFKVVYHILCTYKIKELNILSMKRRLGDTQPETVTGIGSQMNIAEKYTNDKANLPGTMNVKKPSPAINLQPTPEKA